MTASPAHRRAELEADGLLVQGAHVVMLRPTSLTLDAGQVRAVVGEPGHGHTALALALAGRLPYDAGAVTLDGDPTAGRRRAAVALVDVPGVSEPDGPIPLATVIHEELAFARQHRPRRVIRSWVGDLDPSTRFEDVPPPHRVALLLQLAALRPGVRFLVLTLPERYGAEPIHWEPVAREIAASGPGVLVTVGPTTAAGLSVPSSPLGGVAEGRVA